jgi:hypothetical protein
MKEQTANEIIPVPFEGQKPIYPMPPKEEKNEEIEKPSIYIEEMQVI